MILVIERINIWNKVVVHVALNKPEKIPIPVFKKKKYKLSYVIKVEITKIEIVALEYNIDLSRLSVIEFDNSSIINDNVNI